MHNLCCFFDHGNCFGKLTLRVNLNPYSLNRDRIIKGLPLKEIIVSPLSPTMLYPCCLLETFREEMVVRRGDTKKPVLSRTPGLVRSRPTGAAPLSAVQTSERPPLWVQGDGRWCTEAGSTWGTHLKRTSEDSRMTLHLSNTRSCGTFLVRRALVVVQ